MGENAYDITNVHKFNLQARQRSNPCDSTESGGKEEQRTSQSATRAGLVYLSKRTGANNDTCRYVIKKSGGHEPVNRTNNLIAADSF